MKKPENAVEGLYLKTTNLDWKYMTIGLDVKTFTQELEKFKDKINDKGFLNIDVIKSDKGTLWAKLNDYKVDNKEVKSTDHSPDREQVTPF